MTKQEALNIVLNCSKIYHKNLENKNVVFIYEKEYNEYDYIETNFFPHNFLHLTGLNLIKNRNEKFIKNSPFLLIRYKVYVNLALLQQYQTQYHK